MTLDQLQADPRALQITVLATLLVCGVGFLGFDTTWAHVVANLVFALGFQYVCEWFWNPSGSKAGSKAGSKTGWKSALITGLSLCLLLRTHSFWIQLAVAGLAIASKFIFRWRGKHFFNPTCFALCALLALRAPAWVSSGQWGSQAGLGFGFACLGMFVVIRARSLDLAVAFLVFYVTFLFGWSFRLGEPMTIPTHRLESGALLLFTFFMITDPRSTPDSRIGRIVFAFLTAFGGWYIQLRLFRTNSLLWSLVLVSLLTPILDWLFPGSRYSWPGSLPPRKELPRASTHWNPAPA